MVGMREFSTCTRRASFGAVESQGANQWSALVPDVGSELANQLA